MSQTELYEKIADASQTIFSYCMARTNNRYEAENLSQEILCELLRCCGNLRDEKAFYGFMWATAGNVYKQWWRNRQKSTESTLELPEQLPCEEDITDMGDRDDLLLLRRELTLLSSKYRRATILYYIENKSCLDIARILSISESKVKYLLFKSRKILKEGITMERNLGTLSYNPKTLIPFYHGTGPNHFHAFLQSKMRQNILSACYNDALKPEQISLETGIPLPYLDDEIRALEEKHLLLREGSRYSTNLIIITEVCSAEMSRCLSDYHEKIADAIHAFLKDSLPKYKAMGFNGSEFSENTLRWQLATLIFRGIMKFDAGETSIEELPKTAWGDRAFLYCMEAQPETELPIFAYSGVNSRKRHSLLFFDYRPKLHGDHHDFFGNERRINLFCDIAETECFGKVLPTFSEYDLETLAEIVRDGYLTRKEDGTWHCHVPIYTEAQKETLDALVVTFISEKLGPMLQDMKASTVRILENHTPKALKEQIPGIASVDLFDHMICRPAKQMLKKGYLHTDWEPKELPGTFIVLKDA